uniref:C3orf17 protein-like protein n=1 Tax=Callorhinchus milii TaxID=7868 RepID=V9KKQ3_CALMI
MAGPAWNAVTVPLPGSQCTVPVSSDSHTDGCIRVLIPACQNVVKLLRSRVLTAELDVLSSLLYVFHYKLRQHKPYLALKQVEQCVKRLSNMRLEASIRDLIELCPRTSEINKAGTKRVPSQPMLEWTALRVLGGCKLMLRLMDVCSKAFQLAIKHLHWQEFIVLNFIVTGLLSRLWVLSRGILQSLVVLYEKLYPLLKKVEKIQQLPYVKDFTLPANVQEWLGSPYTKVMQEKLKNISSQLSKIPTRIPDLLDKLFSVQEPVLLEAHEAGARVRKPILGNPFKVKQMVDIGCPVQNRTVAVVTGIRSVPEKTSLQTSSHTFSQNTKKSRSTRASTKSKNKELEQPSTEAFVRKIKATQTFKMLSQELKAIFLWFRNRNLRRESRYLGNQYLRSNRRGMLEAQGYSFEKKLQDTKIVVCRYLVKWSQGTRHQNKVLKKRRSKATVLQELKMRHSNASGDEAFAQEEINNARRKKRKRSQRAVPPTLQTVQTEAKRESVVQRLSAESVANVQNPKFSTLIPGSSKAVDAIVETVPKLDSDIDDIFSLIGV